MKIKRTIIVLIWNGVQLDTTIIMDIELLKLEEKSNVLKQLVFTMESE